MHLGGGGDTAVDGNGELREITLELLRQFIPQGRYLAVFFGAQALEPGVARMHDERAAATLGDGADKIAHKIVALVLVNAYAVLDGDRHLHHIDHGLDTIGHQLRLAHQARTKGAALHPLAGAAAVQVDLVIAPLFTQARAVRQISRLTATQLQRHRVFLKVVAQVSRHVTMDQGACGHHLGVQQGTAGQQAVEIAAMSVRPIHHRGNGQPPGRQSGCQGLMGVHKKWVRRCQHGAVQTFGRTISAPPKTESLNAAPGQPPGLTIGQLRRAHSLIPPST